MLTHENEGGSVRPVPARRHTPPQFFIEPSMVKQGYIFLTGEPLRRAVTARLSPGEVFLAVTDDRVYESKVARCGRDGILAEITGQRVPQKEPFHIHLFASILKGDKFDLVVEKVTELGVSSVNPLISKRTIPRISGEKASAKEKRWERIARAASEQCHRTAPPPIGHILPFDRALDRPLQGILIICLEGEGLPPLRSLVDKSNPLRSSEVSVLVGPEGGFEQEEIERALAKGFQPASLGSHVLRAETASIAVVAILAHLLWGHSQEVSRKA